MTLQHSKIQFLWQHVMKIQFKHMGFGKQGDFVQCTFQFKVPLNQGCFTNESRTFTE